MRQAKLTPQDEKYLTLLEDRRDQHFKTAPLLSSFKVLALFAYEDLDGQTDDKFVIGANAECANIGGATCAERAAMAQLQLLPVRRVCKIYLVSDSPQCLTPATANDARDDLFPLRYAAGTQFTDGEIRVTWQHKTLEYGSSLDAVSKLIPFVEAKQQTTEDTPSPEERNIVRPTFIIQVDQFGILHAPFARARAYFFEFGFLDVPVLIHDAEGKLHRVPIGALVAESPDCIAAATAAVQ
ncbi:hypothetical protein BBJ29_003277 [Phytophthora kernoviae]|uniref:Uncharacterized protein n=1 Tax=Phytophthora kernoviae TaxID=325452 RepID=A0A3F2RYN7_9STRA|nr:hypothetical protein BBJ29_003277 [Phytophthora kernoviae]RLN66887.1 hypothetical protein BBP00_00001936 [Phytophthora kernoviae]